MRQIVVEGPRRLKIAEAPVPRPGIGELLVEVKAAAICGTDLHVYAGHTPVSYPRVPGHEGAGVVREVGDGAAGFSAGDAVAINPNLDCNRCEWCILGRENICIDVRLMGRETDGVLREYLTIPQTSAFKLPSHVSFAEGALVQPLSTVVHAQRLADIKPTESVVVLGQGAVGLMHTRLSKLAGAYPVIAIGRSQWKLELAMQMGADFAVSAAQEEPVGRALRITRGLGADVVIEAVGGSEAFDQALAMARPGGRLVAFGISPRPLPSLDLYRLYLAEMTLLFPRAMTRADFHLATALVDSKRLNLRPLVSREYTLEEAVLAFRFAEEEQSRVLRVVMTP